MQSLFLALQFLTIINLGVKTPDDRRFANALIYFPLIGLILGLLLIGLDNFFSLLNFNNLTSAVSLTASLAILTRSMHLDGLADTFDALLSNKPKEQMLTIMRDPHIGAMGTVGIIVAMFLKTAFLYSLGYLNIGSALIVMCVASRWMQVFCMFIFKYAREDGKARIFMENIDTRIFISSSVLAFFSVVLFGGWKGLIAAITAAIAAFIFSKTVSKKIGGITGDIIGAITEISEIIILLVFVIIK